jgi:putative Ca2+/H+ antiporter (TMEM165/GDT1 family)
MSGFFTALVTAFVLIVPVELPDKTFIATLVLATRYKPILVWIGVSAAFFVQCLVAVVAGRLLNLLPENLVEGAVAVLFLAGAILLFRSARQSRAEEQSEEPTIPAEPRSGLRAVGTSFLVLFAAEWGDLSQLLTAGLVARGNNVFGVFLGSWIGLVAVSGTAVLLGRVLLRYVRLSIIRYVAALICLTFAVITGISALR